MRAGQCHPALAAQSVSAFQCYPCGSLLHAKFGDKSLFSVHLAVQGTAVDGARCSAEQAARLDGCAEQLATHQKALNGLTATHVWEKPHQIASQCKIALEKARAARGSDIAAALKYAEERLAELTAAVQAIPSFARRRRLGKARLFVPPPELAIIVQHICSGYGAATVWLHGAPGQGKSALAKGLHDHCHDVRYFSLAHADRLVFLYVHGQQSEGHTLCAMHVCLNAIACSALNRAMRVVLTSLGATQYATAHCVKASSLRQIDANTLSAWFGVPLMHGAVLSSTLDFSSAGGQSGT